MGEYCLRCVTFVYVAFVNSVKLYAQEVRRNFDGQMRHSRHLDLHKKHISVTFKKRTLFCQLTYTIMAPLTKDEMLF